jgi:hypothetical protein
MATLSDSSRALQACHRPRSTSLLSAWQRCVLLPLLFVLICSSTGINSQGDWRLGRSTWYDDNPSMTVDYGSCGFGYLDQQRFPGGQVTALSDAHPFFGGSCG